MKTKSWLILAIVLQFFNARAQDVPPAVSASRLRDQRIQLTWSADEVFALEEASSLSPPVILAAG
jgi:hypothetical protein